MCVFEEIGVQSCDVNVMSLARMFPTLEFDLGTDRALKK